MSSMLLDTTLAAIVRDEEECAIIGIEPWARMILPYVSAAVILDTGSVDKTYEVLKRLSREFSHLTVLKEKFNGFAQARNTTLKHVRTRRAFVLDADETIDSEDLPQLAKFLETNSKVDCFNFTFREVYADGLIQHTIMDSLLTRIFDVNGISYVNADNGYGEYIQSGLLSSGIDSPVMITHFRPSRESLALKMENWYRQAAWQRNVSPGDLGRRQGWKARHPAVYIKASHLDDIYRVQCNKKI